MIVYSDIVFSYTVTHTFPVIVITHNTSLSLSTYHFYGSVLHQIKTYFFLHIFMS